MDKEELVKLIKHHNYKYWIENNPEISDSEYDKLVLKLKEIDPDNELLTNLIPIPLDNKIKHTSPMLSLDKVFTYDEIINWAKKIANNSEEEFLITPKYDGVSARYYANVNLLATRGDGYNGENITNKIPLIEFISNNLNNNKNINGEIIVLIDTFNNTSITKPDGNKYSTPRNLVAGILNLKNIDNLIGKIKLIFIEHDYTKEIVKLKDFTKDYWNNILEITENLKKIYPLDGIVIEIKDFEKFGFTNHHPKGKIAYKFDSNFEYSTIRDIVYSSGKKKLTPVAIIDPVVINNVTIKRVTLHNAKMIIDNNIHIGDKVKIVRSGDIIPYIAAVYEGDSRKEINIENCPYCKSKLIYKEPDLYCSNINCIGTFSRSIYESIKTLGINEIGLPTIEKFIEFLKITSIIDIFNLTVNDIKILPEFGEKSAQNIIDNINKIKSGIEDYKILSSLNIPNVNTSICKEILLKFTLEDFLNNNVKYEDLLSIPTIGEIRAKNIINEINNKYDILYQLCKIVNIIKTNNSINMGSICFSGNFPNKKDYYKNLAISKGYVIKDNVTKDLTYLVTSGASTTKVNRAKELNIKVISLEEFLMLMK